MVLGWGNIQIQMQIRIRDLVSPVLGSGMKKVGSGILDKHPGSAILVLG
jgi:hypothetical protein